jgi:hypothetical protein
MKEKVSLQINLSPSDYPLARWVLPHQIKRLDSQVDEIVLTLESIQSKGRFAENWDDNIKNIRGLLTSILAVNPKARLCQVDYSEARNTEIAGAYFKNKLVPHKDYRGGPFYSYFFGIHECKYDYVLHLDSDMLLGGGAEDRWIPTAIGFLQKQSEIFCCSPLPGPPTLHGDIHQVTVRSNNILREYEFNSFSTRIYFFDRRQLAKHKLELTRPSIKKIVMASLDGNNRSELPEVLVSDMMRKAGLRRLDFLGANAGLWSLHPPFKGPRFCAHLPGLIETIERGDVPPAQRGHYDIREELYDFSLERDAMKQNRWWRRLSRRVASGIR